MVTFQIVDIISDDIPNGKGKNFQVTIYGKTGPRIHPSDSSEIEKARTIICNVNGFKPYFYLKIPDAWEISDVNEFIKNMPESISKGVPVYLRGDFIELKDKTKSLIPCNELYGFKCDEKGERLKCKFAKLSFNSYSSMCKYSEAIRKKYSILRRKDKNKETNYHNKYKQWLKLDKDDMCDSYLYESNIHPIIKFIHTCDIQPANWICVDIDEEELDDDMGGLFPQAELYIEDIHYTKITPSSIDSISPYVIASFDIECDSSHGDFPQANKEFKKLAIDIYDAFGTGITSGSIKRILNQSLKTSFSLYDETFQDIHKNIHVNIIFTKGDKKPSVKSINNFIEIFNGKEDDTTGISDKFVEKFNDPKQRDSIINELTLHLNKLRGDDNKLLEVEGDKVIQIGTVFHKYGDDHPYKRHILVIAPEDNLSDAEICSKLDNIDVVPCKNEMELLLGWKDIMKKEDPDFVTGYNIFGFDFAYMIDRMKVYCKCNNKKCKSSCPFNKFLDIGKINTLHTNEYNKKCCEKKKKTMTFGSTDYNRYLHMDGRVLYDLQKEVEKGHNLESYKLDNVAAHFMRGKIKKVESTHLYTNDFGNLKDGDYISLRLHSNIGETYHENGKKYKINKLIHKSYLDMEDEIHIDMTEYLKVEWCLMKDDVSPQDIFEKHKSGGPGGRSEVAKYCIQDCELCINLTLALDIIPNNIAMANVCSVPQSYIYLRGQGAKIFSLISKVCDENGIRIPTLKRPREIHSYIKIFNNELNKDVFKLKYRLVQDVCKEWEGVDFPSEEQFKIELKNGETDTSGGWRPYKIYDINDWFDEIMNPPPRAGYEGAIVLEPEAGIYLDDPVGVVDYASLYPSSIIEKNISHDTLIEDPKYLDYLGKDKYETIEYDNYIYEEEEGKVTISKKIDENDPKITCHFLKKVEGQPLGIIPTVVQHLLDQRKATKNRLKKETNEFKKSVLDGLQLAYKLVANSVYGQMGARTSPIYKNKLAACTTAIGRERIYDAKRGIENRWWNESEEAIKWGCRQPKVIYGDTDSVFVKWSRFKNDKELEGKEALEFCIECGKDAGKWVTENMLNNPQDLEYEKTFYPFILISKKRYVADKYEFNSDECKRNSMGIVLKRRDNAPIVKHVFGNVIEKIMIDKNFEKTVIWLQETLREICKGEFEDHNFIITKSLRGYYKNPGGIAHKVLADRMGERDPGNKPKPGDRMPYVYHVVDDKPIHVGNFKNGKPKYKKKKILQGDRIEDPEYIKNNPELKIDYRFYITNQIMNPVKQVLDLGMDPEATLKIFQLN